MQIPLRKFIAPEFIYGTDAALLAAQYAQNIDAAHVLVVTDSKVATQNWFSRITHQLSIFSIGYTTFDSVTENPKDYECVMGAKAYQDNHCDLILAIGGGSVMDCAKAIGILVSNGGLISDYEGIDEITAAIPPLICVPTTAGSAADISQFAIITNTKDHYKMALVSKTLVPDLALIDPALTLTVDFDTTIDTGLDVLAHAIESFVSNASSPATRLHATDAIRRVLRSLPALSQNLNNLKLRDSLMQASLQAGLSFSNASLGLIHAVAHALGGRFNLIHGELNGILLPAVCAFNAYEAVDAFRDINMIFEQECHYSGGTTEMYLKDFINSIRPNRGIESQGVSSEAFEKLIPTILSDPCVVTNPREVTPESVMALYESIR